MINEVRYTEVLVFIREESHLKHPEVHAAKDWVHLPQHINCCLYTAAIHHK